MKIFPILFIQLIIALNLYSQSIPEPERIRTYDVLHYDFFISPDILNKNIKGYGKIKLSPLNNGFNKFEIDAISFNINNIFINGFETKDFDYDGKKLNINLNKDYNISDTLLCEINYSCSPQAGLYFIYPTELNPDFPMQIWSQGQSEDNKHWIPIYDYPNDKSTSEIKVELDENLVSISNGYLKESYPSDNPGKRIDHWVMDKPHSSYLIMLGAGDYHIVKDNSQIVPVESYVYKNRINEGEYSFRNTGAMMELFNEYFDYVYPWVNYKQVVVKDFIYGGMENTTATVLNERSYYTPEIENDYSSDGLIAHELGHQWWGDLTTCRNWSELWLNESFATFCNDIWTQKFHGEDEFDYEMLKNQDDATRAQNRVGKFSIWAGNGSLTANNYSKGSVIINSMRKVLGDFYFKKSLNKFLKDNEYGIVETQDLINAVNETVNETSIGKDYKWMFDQWIWKAGYPEFDVSWNYDDERKKIIYEVKQLKPADTLTPVFKMPVDLLISYDTLKFVQNINIEGLENKFEIDFPAKPEFIVFDHGNHFLEKLNYKRDRIEIYNQIIKSEKPIDRIMAIRELKTYPYDNLILEVLINKLKTDEFWAVRYEAALALSEYKRDNVVKSLIDAYSFQNNSKVKRGIVDAIGIIKLSSGESFLNQLLLSEKNEYIISEVLKSLTKILPDSKYPDILISYKDTESHRHVIKLAVVQGLDSAARIKPDEKIKNVLLDIAFGKNIDARVRVESVQALVYFAKDDDVNQKAFQYIDWNYNPMKVALIKLLGASGNKKYIEPLKKMNEKTTVRSVNLAIIGAVKNLEK